MEILEKVLGAIERNPNLSLLLGLVVLLLIGIYVVVPLGKPLIIALTTKSHTDGEVLGALSDIANERLESIEKKLDAAIEQNKAVIVRFDAIVKASQAQVVTLEAAYDRLNGEIIKLISQHDYRTKQRYEVMESFMKDNTREIFEFKQIINMLALEIRSPERGKDTEPVVITETTVTVTTKDMPE